MIGPLRPTGELGSLTADVGADSSAKLLTAVIADERPVIRAGVLTAVRASEDISEVVTCDYRDAVETIDRVVPEVLIIVVRDGDTEPFRIVATTKALHAELRVLALADSTNVTDLREAVISGVDSFLLTSASLADIRDAAANTGRGERVVSPEVAMQLAGSWRRDLDQSMASSLTPREIEVLELLAEGMTNQEIGDHLTVSARTIKTHVQNLLTKLDVPDRTGAVARAFRLGVIR